MDRVAEIAFATALETRRQDGQSELAWAVRTYFPSFPGVHICDGDDDENRAFTVFDCPAVTPQQARAAWEAAKAECECSRAEGDLVVDLNDDEYHIDDFWTSRQMLPRLAQIVRHHLEASLTEAGRG